VVCCGVCCVFRCVLGVSVVCVVLCIGVYWCVLVCFGCVLIHFGVLWCVIMFVDLFTRVVDCCDVFGVSGVFWSEGGVYVVCCWCVVVCVGVFLCVEVCCGDLMYAGIRFSAYRARTSAAASQCIKFDDGRSVLKHCFEKRTCP
jgi:hypothetical protein